MTYLRLHHGILLGSTLMLASAWWFSLRNYAHFTVNPAPGGLVLWGSLHSGTLDFRLITRTPATLRLPSQIRTVHDPAGVAALGGGYPVTGNFLFNHQRKEKPTTGVYHDYDLEFPVWVPWLLIVTFSYGATRIMSKPSPGVPGLEPSEVRTEQERP